MTKKLFFIISFAVVLLLYYPALTTYFSQDDFFHFKISQTGNPFGFYSFAKRGVAFYRPISRELLFHLYYLIFGLNSIPFRIFAFLIHFINITLVYLLTKKLFRAKGLAFFVAFFFGITAANVATLYYLAGGVQTLLVTTFTLSSLLYFIKFLENKKLGFIISSFILFLLGLGSMEQAMIIPILMLGLTFVYQPKQLKNTFFQLIPFFVVTCILIYLEIFKIGFSSSEQQYHAVFNIKTTLNSLFWYSNWALGIPETLIDFVNPGFKLNPTLLRYWSNYYIFIFPAYFISIILLGISTIYLLLKQRKIFASRQFLLCIFWFPLGLLPVILLPLHKSTHYLEISLPAFWAVIGFIALNFYLAIKNSNHIIAKIYLSLVVISLVTLSSASAILGSTNYWAAQRGKIAEKLIQQIKTSYPSLPKGAVVYIKNDPNYPKLTQEWGSSSQQANFILNGSDGLQLLYKDPTLRVYYEDVEELPKNISKHDIYSFMAKIY